jgi:hypothetical protein
MPMPGERPLKAEILIMEQQQFIVRRQTYVSHRGCDVPTGPVIDFLDRGRIKEACLAHLLPRSAQGSGCTQHLVGRREILRYHLVAERRNDSRPSGFVFTQEIK